MGTAGKAARGNICNFLLYSIRILQMSFVSPAGTGDIKSHKQLAQNVTYTTRNYINKLSETECKKLFSNFKSHPTFRKNKHIPIHTGVTG